VKSAGSNPASRTIYANKHNTHGKRRKDTSGSGLQERDESGEGISTLGEDRTVRGQKTGRGESTEIQGPDRSDNRSFELGEKALPHRTSSSPKTYLLLEDFLGMLKEETAGKFRRLYQDHKEKIEEAKGSSFNHQNWVGGYNDHVLEMLNIADKLYWTLNLCRQLPFSFADVIICILVHDVEKPWKDEATEYILGAPSKIERHSRRISLVETYGIELTEDQSNGVFYAEGEHQDYSRHERRMRELAAFVHACDVISARMWHDRPLLNDEWGKRSKE
jgi:hypothetical protein